MTDTEQKLHDLVRTLRHQLCYHYFESTIAAKVRDQNSHRDQAFAYAMSLRHVETAFGPLPRTSCQAPKQTTLNGAAILATRQWLETSADAILGPARHIMPPGGGVPYSPKGVKIVDSETMATATCPSCAEVFLGQTSKFATELYARHFVDEAQKEAQAA